MYARKVEIRLDNEDIVTRIKFCERYEENTKDLQYYILGMSKYDIIKKLEKIDCRGRRILILI
uniref:TSCPD domain-containing protein n=1 Tax=Fusobacterium necrogenes TaxID=858 RepID=UPI00248260FA|nr:TSCPD domain-containing protein [Fusobacterium necrogenes]